MRFLVLPRSNNAYIDSLVGLRFALKNNAYSQYLSADIDLDVDLKLVPNRNAWEIFMLYKFEK